MFLFPAFYSCFKCTIPLECVERAAVNMVEQNSYELRQITKRADSVMISFLVQTQSLFYHDSFLPEVRIRCSKLGESNQISICFELKKTTKYFSIIYCAVAILLEVTLILLILSGNMLLSPAVFIPIALILFSYASTFVGLWKSAKAALSMIIATLFPGLLGNAELKFGDIVSPQWKSKK